MKHLILIIPPTSVRNFNYNAAKKNIVSYLGTRLVEYSDEEIPGIVIKEALDSEDKQAIQDAIFPNNQPGVIIFVAYDEYDESRDSYLSVKKL